MEIATTEFFARIQRYDEKALNGCKIIYLLFFLGSIARAFDSKHEQSSVGGTSECPPYDNKYTKCMC